MKPQPKPDCDFRDGLKGQVYCGDCGRAIRFAISKFGKGQTTLYTRCSSYLKYSALCTRHSISMNRLTEIIRRELEHQVDLVQTTEELLRQLSVSDDGKIAALKRQLQSVKVCRQHMDGRKNQLLVDYMDKVLEKDEFLYIKDKYDAEAAALMEEEAAIQSQLAEFAQLRRSAEQWAAAMRGYQRDRQLSNDLLREVVERIDLYEREREMSVHLTFRYQDIFQKVMTYMGGVADGTAQTKL